MDIAADDRGGEDPHVGAIEGRRACENRADVALADGGALRVEHAYPGAIGPGRGGVQAKDGRLFDGCLLGRHLARAVVPDLFALWRVVRGVTIRVQPDPTGAAIYASHVVHLCEP